MSGVYCHECYSNGGSCGYVQATEPHEDAVPGLLLNTLRRGPNCSVLSFRSFQSLMLRISSEPFAYAETQDMRMVACISFSSSFREAHSTGESMMIQRKAGPREAIIWARRTRRPPGSFLLWCVSSSRYIWRSTPILFLQEQIKDIIIINRFEFRSKRGHFASPEHYLTVG
jgi:hypothetical protein